MAEEEENKYLVEKKRDCTIVRRPGELGGSDFGVDDIQNCTLMVLDHTTQVGALQNSAAPPHRPEAWGRNTWGVFRV